MQVALFCILLIMHLNGQVTLPWWPQPGFYNQFLFKYLYYSYSKCTLPDHPVLILASVYSHEDDCLIPYHLLSDEPTFNSFPIIVTSPNYELAPQPPWDGSHYPSQDQHSYLDPYP